MKNARHLALAIGILLALGTGVMLLNYVGSVRSASASAAPMRTVLVATQNIPARALLVNAYFAKTQKPASDVDSDAAADPRELAGKYSLINIPAGSVISRSKVSAAAANALPARLPVGMRAVSISIDRVKGVAGLIQPGDRVDVIAVPPRVGSETPQASAILRGVLVLAMGNEVETTSATPAPDNQNLTTVTLALTPAQVDLLAAADLNTTLRLALRPPKEPVHSFSTEPLTLGAPPERVVTAPGGAAQPPPAVAAAPVRSQPAPRTGVTVIDGDHIAEYGTYHP